MDNDLDAVWRGMVQKHTSGGACNFRNAAFQFAEEVAGHERRRYDELFAAYTDVCVEAARTGAVVSDEGRPVAGLQPSSRNHIMSDAVLLRTIARSASNISEAARAQLLAIADDV